MNLLNIIKNYIPAGLVQDAAKQTGESESSISSMISAAIPTVLGGLISKSSSDSNGIFSMAQNALSSNILGNLGGILGSNEASTTGGFNIWTILKSIFGDKLSGVVSSLAGFAGVKESSAQSVLGLTSAATLGAVGAHAKENNLDANGLTSFLGSQKANLASWMPSGFDFSAIAGGLGLSSLFAGSAASAATNVSAASTPSTTTSYSSRPEEPKKGNGWLVPLIILAVLAGLIWWFMKGCNKEGDTTTNPVTNTTTDTGLNNSTTPPTETTTTIPSRETIKVKLPSGAEIDAFKGGIEDQMVTFLTSEEYKNATPEALKDKWFNFDNLNFIFGKKELTDSSKIQMQNIVAILKEFKDAKIKVGAYTDSVGDPAKNVTLSSERANHVKSELAKAGVGAQVPEAEGYGSKFAKFPASASDADRATDRKTAIRFIKP